MPLQESRDQHDQNEHRATYFEALIKTTPVLVTVAIAPLFILNFFYPINYVGVALIIIAIVPWLLPFILQINLPGGGSIQLRNVREELEKQMGKIKDQDRRIEKQENEIKEQKKISDELALTIYSLGENVYRHLEGITKAQKNRDPYVFYNNDTMPQDFRFLINSGYMKWFDFSYWNDKNIAGEDLVTPAGRILVHLRERYAEAEPRH